jgi:hypothetical protein
MELVYGVVRTAGSRTGDVHQFDRGGAAETFDAQSNVRSGVLPRLRLKVSSVLDV